MVNVWTQNRIYLCSSIQLNDSIAGTSTLLKRIVYLMSLQTEKETLMNELNDTQREKQKYRTKREKLKVKIKGLIDSIAGQIHKYMYNELVFATETGYLGLSICKSTRSEYKKCGE
eukprot:143770_1